MDTHNLVHMANRIGEFFQTLPDAAMAHADIAQHIRKFWEPRMRLRLLQHIDQDGAPQLMPLVRDAMLAHRTLMAPHPDWSAHQPQTKPATSATPPASPAAPAHPA